MERKRWIWERGLQNLTGAISRRSGREGEAQCSPIIPQCLLRCASRTKLGHRATSQMCQLRTHAVQHAAWSSQSPRPRARFSLALRFPVGSSHSTSLSASTRREFGIVRPSTFAVLRLMTRSNFVARSIGRSPGAAPFRIIPT
jgi:hypothetical protein